MRSQVAGLVGVRDEGDEAAIRGVDGVVAPGARAYRQRIQLLVGLSGWEDAHEGKALLEQRAHGEGQLEGDRARILCLDRLDEREQRGVEVAFLVAGEGVAHVVHRQRRAVGEHRALAQRHLVLQIGHLKRDLGG